MSTLAPVQFDPPNFFLSLQMMTTDHIYIYISSIRGKASSKLRHSHCLSRLDQLGPITTIGLRHALTQLIGQQTAITQDDKLAARFLCDDQLDGVEQPAHDGGDIDEELAGQRLRVVVAEDLNRLVCRGLDERVAPDKRDLEVVVDLEALVGVGPFAVVGDWDAGAREGERLDRFLH